MDSMNILYVTLLTVIVLVLIGLVVIILEKYSQRNESELITFFEEAANTTRNYSSITNNSSLEEFDEVPQTFTSTFGSPSSIMSDESQPMPMSTNESQPLPISTNEPQPLITAISSHSLIFIESHSNVLAISNVNSVQSNSIQNASPGARKNSITLNHQNSDYECV